MIEIASFLQRLTKIIQKLHALRIIHRDIRLENILVKPKKTYSAKGKKSGAVPLHALKVQIMGLDLAFCFERDNEQVCQALEVQGCEFAPEVKAGLPQGQAVDVWGLGLVTV